MIYEVAVEKTWHIMRQKYYYREISELHKHFTRMFEMFRTRHSEVREARSHETTLESGQ